MKAVKQAQHGGFVLGLVFGLLLGLALALGVALYITKVPVPFIDKVPQRTAEQDQAEQQRNRNWDPNAPLAGKPPRVAGAASASASGAAPGALAGSAPAATSATTAAAAASGAGRDPAAILSGAMTPGTQAAAKGIVFFVQTGAYTRAEEAEQQRARLAMLGHGARVSEREQHGRVVYRVRLGPYPTRGEAEGLQGRLQAERIESQLVRAEQRP
jgi:cell division protein FtsN